MTPVLWTFRRCPYAMRARLAILASGQRVEWREILLRDKPDQMLAASPKGTVPVLDLGAGRVIAESRDIMLWALGRHDPGQWLLMPPAGHGLISQCDGPFKTALDRTKYHVRYADADPAVERAKAAEFLMGLETQLSQGFLFGEAPRLADMAVLPFVRQFANTDRAWFDAQPWPNVIAWLDAFLRSETFCCIMTKRAPWQSGAEAVYFPR